MTTPKKKKKEEVYCYDCTFNREEPCTTRRCANYPDTSKAARSPKKKRVIKAFGIVEKGPYFEKGALHLAVPHDPETEFPFAIYRKQVPGSIPVTITYTLPQ